MLGKELSIIDSTTILLFKDILRCVGRKPINGKSKGGIKAHLQIWADYKDNVKFSAQQEYSLDNGTDDAVLKDEQITLPVRENGTVVRQLPLRRIAYWNEQHNKCY